ncbi:hypothetical protein [Desulfovibrio sp. SGI.169]|uniref:hypothetical protein n=1 Tax=Desulfovibrio sp. SGI.169 TaxID=3420561 RepID=UPI003D025561
MSTTPFVTQPELTAIAIAYMQQPADYIADLVMPRVKAVGKREFKYQEYGLESYSRPDTRVGRKGVPNEVNWASSEKTAAIEDYGLEDPIPQDDIDQGARDGRNVTGESTEYIMGLLRLDRECRVASIVQDAGNYASANVKTLTAGQGVDNDNTDAESLIFDLLETPIVRPNVAVMSRLVWSKLSRNAKLVKAIKGSLGSAKVTPEEFTAHFELAALHIGPARVSRTPKGRAPSLERVWGPTIAFHYRDLAATEQRGVTWGVTVPYGTPVAGATPDGNIGLRGGVRVRAGESLKELVLAKDAGCLLRNVIAV